MTVNLDILKQHRDDLLLAEVAALLHDVGKCTDGFLQPEGTGFQAIRCHGRPWVNPHKAIFEPNELQQLPYWNQLSPNRGQCSRLEEANHPTALWRQLQQVNLHRLDFPVKLINIGEITGRELILWGRPLVSDNFTGFQSVLGDRVILAAYLGRAHGAAHIEKEESPSVSSQFISTPFGFECTPLSALNAKLQRVLSAVFSLLDALSSRKNCLKNIKEEFLLALGDSRYPENEVTLWDWSSTVAALYKAALAGALLGYQPGPNELRWRLLSIRFDGLSFFPQTHRIPDLLARRALLDEALDQIRDLLEVEYPLGIEVYRDENGSIFVVPGCEKGQCTLDLLALTDANQKSLRTLILERVQAIVEGELVPTIQIDSVPWWGQDPQRQGNDEIPPVPDHLRPVTNATDADWVRQQWDGRQEEICTVCGLRPQGPGKKAKDRNICDVCEKRRANRAEEWAKKLDTTIWTDEVADTNGRLALVVGQFNLDHWLDGTMVQTLLVTQPQAGTASKTPSFARLRRIWETTRTFWQEVLPTEPQRDIANSLVGTVLKSQGPRLEIIPQGRGTLNLGAFHTYDLVINGIHLSVVWDDANQRFITCDNLDYLAKPEQLGQPVKDALRAQNAQNGQKGRALTLEEPVGYGAKNKVLGTITIDDVKELQDRYVPAIPILAEPQIFMALVPADKALEVVKAIKAKYEREMGKVRNRLPLTLGVVYFGRRTPLAAALDAGRRMIHQPVRTIRAEVKELDPPAVTDTTWPVERKVTLRIGEREITLSVPTVMGDGQTQDVWYPYWQVEGHPTDRTRWFVGPDGEHWVHVCDLKRGNLVAFTPSTFDYEYLDTTTRRFEVIYGSSGQRRSPEKRQRPYLLEELDELEQAWQEISRLSKSQIYAVISAIEAKREAWSQPLGNKALALHPNDAFRQFVSDTLREAGIYTPFLERAALSGMLRDALEIHLEIMTSL